MSLSCYLFWRVKIKSLHFSRVAVHLLSLAWTPFRFYCNKSRWMWQTEKKKIIIVEQKRDEQEKKKELQARNECSTKLRECVSLSLYGSGTRRLPHDSRKWKTAHHSSLFALAKRSVIIFYIFASIVHLYKHPYGVRCVAVYCSSFVRLFAYQASSKRIKFN